MGLGRFYLIPWFSGDAWLLQFSMILTNRLHTSSLIFGMASLFFLYLSVIAERVPLASVVDLSSSRTSEVYC
jgi:hypothetical protein